MKKIKMKNQMIQKMMNKIKKIVMVKIYFLKISKSLCF